VNILVDFSQALYIDSSALIDQFRVWVFSSICSLAVENIYLKVFSEFWCIMGVNERWKELSTIALRLFATPASESVAERGFSAKKKIVGNHRRNLNHDLLKSLMKALY